MKFSIQSDLHMEFGSGASVANALPEADVTVLAGDITLAHDLRPHRTDNVGKKARKAFDTLIEAAFSRSDHVVYVPGNHELYRWNYPDADQFLRELCAERGIHYLNGDNVVLCGVNFVGAMLGTDMNGRNPIAMLHCKDLLNDFKIIENWKPEDQADLFDRHWAFITSHLDNKRPNVVVTHHAPSLRSIDKRYANEYYTNAAYASNCDMKIEYLETPPDFWVHGHMHHTNDYMIGNTRVVSNPYGYQGYERNKAFTPTTFELESQYDQ